MMNRETDATIWEIEFEHEKAEHGMALSYDAEHAAQLRRMLRRAEAEAFRRTGGRCAFMTLKMRPTGLGHGVYKDVPDYGVFCGEWCIVDRD